MSFKDQRRAIFESGTCFGNPDHLAASATYTPLGGTPRTVIVATQAAEHGGAVTEFDARQPEQMWIDVARDPNCRRGGIDAPQAGDQLLLASDPAGASWLFDEQYRNVTDFSWQLLFRRAWTRGRGPRSK